YPGTAHYLFRISWPESYLCDSVIADKQVRKSDLILLPSVASLLSLQWTFPFIPVSAPHCKNSNCFTHYLAEQLDSNLTSRIDSSLREQMDTTIAEADVVDSTQLSDSLPPLAQLDESWFASDSFIVPDTANIAQLEKFLSSLGDT